MSTPFTDALEAQGTLTPGTEGYWQVWGASVRDVRAGDLVLLKYADYPEPLEYEVAAYDPRVADHDSPADAVAGRGSSLADQIRPRFKTPLDETFTIGALQPVVLLRKGTHNMLSDYVG